MSISNILNTDIFTVTGHLKKKAKDCEDLKQKYVKVLAETKGEEVFKYLLLLNLITCEGYTTQTQLQAQQSFRLSRLVAVVGFVLMIGGVVAGISSQMLAQNRLEIIYLSTAIGLITEFISGIFFYLYNRTLRQMNLFHDQLQIQQKIAMSLFLNGLVTDTTKRDADRLDIIKSLFLTIQPIQFNQVQSANSVEIAPSNGAT